MCNPALAVMAVMAVASIATGVTSYVQSENQADAEKKAAEGAAASDYQRSVVQQEQINASAAQDMTERLRQSMKERAAIRVSSGEAGLSTGREELTAYQSASKDLAILENNRAGSVEQAQAEKQAIFANAQGRINTAQSRVPAPWMAGLQIGASAAASAASGYATGRSIMKS